MRIRRWVWLIVIAGWLQGPSRVSADPQPPPPPQVALPLSGAFIFTRDSEATKVWFVANGRLMEVSKLPPNVAVQEAHVVRWETTFGGAPACLLKYGGVWHYQGMTAGQEALEVSADHAYVGPLGQSFVFVRSGHPGNGGDVIRLVGRGLKGWEYRTIGTARHGTPVRLTDRYKRIFFETEEGLGWAQPDGPAWELLVPASELRGRWEVGLYGEEVALGIPPPGGAASLNDVEVRAVLANKAIAPIRIVVKPGLGPVGVIFTGKTLLAAHPAAGALLTTWQTDFTGAGTVRAGKATHCLLTGGDPHNPVVAGPSWVCAHAYCVSSYGLQETGPVQVNADSDRIFATTMVEGSPPAAHDRPLQALVAFQPYSDPKVFQIAADRFLDGSVGSAAWLDFEFLAFLKQPPEGTDVCIGDARVDARLWCPLKATRIGRFLGAGTGESRTEKTQGVALVDGGECPKLTGVGWVTFTRTLLAWTAELHQVSLPAPPFAVLTRDAPDYRPDLSPVSRAYVTGNCPMGR